MITGFRHLIWYNLSICTKLGTPIGHQFGSWIVYKICCKGSCTKFGTNFKDTLAYSYCFFAILGINFIPNLVHYVCTKFGTNFVIPLISLSYLKGGSKLLQSVLHHVLENDWSICILKIHSPYCVSSPCNNQMKTVVINHRTMLIIVQACAFNCAPCGVEWSQYHQNKWI